MTKTTRPFRFSKPERSFLLIVFICYSFNGFSQNKLRTQIAAQHIETISINGNQIFDISVSTSKTDQINVTSTLDGEYQDDYQVVVKEDNHRLNLSLKHSSLTDIPDDKRNAHKVIAATLHLEIPEQLTLHILSDIGAVNLKGNFYSLHIKLLQGQCTITGEAKSATVNTLDGDINVETKSATIEANSNHGKVTIDMFHDTNSIWKLTSTNGDITVTEQE